MANDEMRHHFKGAITNIAERQYSLQLSEKLF